MEQKLTAELHAAREQVRTATGTEDKAEALEAFHLALERLKNFVIRPGRGPRRSSA